LIIEIHDYSENESTRQRNARRKDME
jgi:hypothetical protein